MDIIHEKTKTVVAKNVRLLQKTGEISRGLMFTRRKQDFCLYFQFEKPVRYDLHMWFVFYPIDVVILDKQGTIIEIIEHFKPFAIHFPKQDYSAFAELPAGSIKRYDLHIGKMLKLASISECD
ncbi:MAG: DUF192 domain-containing protein [Nanoarchaeota archaeon]